MSQKLKEALSQKFNQHDVVFWYDENNEFLEEFKQLAIQGIKTIHVEGNEFEVKYRVTHKNPEDKFLLYFNTKKPADYENWLLDLELAYHSFHTDQKAIILQELGLDYDFKSLIKEHFKFFDAKERLEKLKSLLHKTDTHKDIKAKMLAVLFKTTHVNINTFVLEHILAFSNNEDSIEKELDRFDLTNFYWEAIEKHFNYKTDVPKIYDFLVEAFTTSQVVKKEATLYHEANYLLSTWKDMVSYRTCFDKVSEQISKDLNIEQELIDCPLETIINEDLFKITNHKIIHELINRLSDDDISDENLQNIIKDRENKFWYADFKAFYQCLSFCSELKTQIKATKYAFNSIHDGITTYSQSHYKIDYLYRKFIFWYRKTNQNSILNDLAKYTEKLYCNTWLLSYNNAWQKIINHTDQWPYKKEYSQRNFFNKYVQPFIDKNQRVFVIISDAFRYECAKELNDTLIKENRYYSSIDASLSVLPSYTQLGMASLLPHNNIQIDENTDTVSVDGMKANGLQGRDNILAKNTNARTKAIKATDFMQFNANTDGREFVKQYDVIYIYHNRIDKTGDDKTTEDRLVEAVDDEILYLKELLKKIANMNGNNMLITADHGFLYQYQPIDESDFMKINSEENIIKHNRRFIMGSHLKENPSIKTFTYKQLGIENNGEVGLAKSVNRIRVKGAGSKFVHGGASLQEIVIPVIKVNKKRQDTTEPVEIDIIKTTDKITTNLLPVSFIQTDAVSKTRLKRTIRAVIIANDNTEISDVFKYSFDIEEENPRQREVKHNFQLTALASQNYKNQRVKLLLEEPMKKSNKWKTYKEFYYTLNISFTNDFDGF